MNDINFLTKAKAEIERAKTDFATNKARLEMLKKQLSEFGCEKVEEVDEVINDIDKNIQEKQNVFTKQIEKLKKYQWGF